MSGTMSGALPPIRLTMEGQDVVERAMDAVGAAAGRMAQQTAQAGQGFGTLSTAAEASARIVAGMNAGLGTLGTTIGRLGGDFSVLGGVVDRAGVAATGLLRVMTGGAGLVPALGALGAAAGAAYATFQNWEPITRSLGQAFDFLTGRVRVNEQAVRDASAGVLAFIRLSEDAAERSRRLYREGMANIRDQATASAAALTQNMEGMQAQLGRLTRGARVGTSVDATIDALEANPSRTAPENAILDSLRRQQAALRQESAAAAARLESDPEAQRLRGIIDFLERQIAAQQNIAALAEARIHGSVQDGSGANNRTVPPARRAGGGSQRNPNLYGPLDDQGPERARQAALDRTREQQQQLQRIEREEARRLERIEEANRRTTDSIVQYGAERFADLFDKNGRGWAGMWETMERTARTTLARIAAELILRPVVQPIVESLNLGGGGTLSGVAGLFGLGGPAGGGVRAGGGGGFASAGALSGAASGGGSGGWFGGIGSTVSGWMNTPIYSSGGGFFGPSSIAAPAGYGSMTLETMPAMSPATTGQNFATVGQGIAAAGTGFAVGSMAGGAIASSPARAQNAMAGAAGGAVAGAIVGSVFPVIGTAIGALVGGIIGGLGGSQIGPGGKGFSGGDVAIGVDASGRLAVVGYGGKNFDGGPAQQQVAQGLNPLNQVLSATQTRIVNPGGYQFRGATAIGQQGFGDSRAAFGPDQIFQRIRSFLVSDDPTMETVLRRGTLTDFQDFAAAGDFIRQVYEPLVASTKTDEERLADSIEKLRESFDKAIETAARYGLSTDPLIVARERALEQARQPQGAASAATTAAASTLLAQLTVGGAGGLSPDAQYLAGLQLLQQRRGGSLESYAEAVQFLLPAARGYLGTSERYSALVAGIGADVRGMGGDPAGLAAILEAQSGGAAAIDRFAGLQSVTNDELRGLRSDLRTMILELEVLIARRTAA